MKSVYNDLIDRSTLVSAGATGSGLTLVAHVCAKQKSNVNGGA